MNYFYINNVPFKPPANLPKSIYKRVDSWRAIDGTLTVDILDFGPKVEMIWEYERLTADEFNFLQEYNFGVWPVLCTLTDYEFDFNALIELREYEESFAGSKRKLKVSVKQQ
jgi:hypothetical protein